MSWSLVPLASAASQPWRNGGGITRELLAWPTAENWRVRISVADVHEDGPFSRFNDIERWFAVLEGQGVALCAGDQVHRLTAASEPFPFDGGQPVECALLGGVTRDFNLMAAPGKAQLRRVSGVRPVLTSEPVLLAVYAHAHVAQVTLAGEVVEVPPAHLAWRLQERPVSGTVRSEDALFVEAR
jgi:uncharacterized protein